jgi:putative endonuclease
VAEWSLYIIRTRGGALYTGITTDVARRFAEHQTGGPRCAKYLRGRRPLQLVFQQEIGTRSAALQAETAVKKLPKAAKEALISGHRSL